MGSTTVPLILPIGPQIVTRSELPATADRAAVAAGAVGVIVRAPTYGEVHEYHSP